MAGRRDRNRPPVRTSLLAKFLLVLLLVAAVWELHGLSGKVDTAQAERDALSAQAEALRQENERLSSDIEAGTTPDKIEEIARNELGMLSPGEYLFPDGID